MKVSICTDILLTEPDGIPQNPCNDEKQLNQSSGITKKHNSNAQ